MNVSQYEAQRITQKSSVANIFHALPIRIRCPSTPPGMRVRTGRIAALRLVSVKKQLPPFCRVDQQKRTSKARHFLA
jgi:hypothetical protein